MICIGKSGMYFTHHHPCSERGFVMPNFWKWSENGELDAYICDNHANFWLMGHPGTKGSYLTEKILEHRPTAVKRWAK